MTASTALAAPGVLASGAPASGVRSEVLRAMLRQHATGVAVITTRDRTSDDIRAGGPVGFCATSLSSVSLEPPMICFSVALSSTSGRAWRSAAYGLVHLLCSDQAAVAATFARSGPGKFDQSTGWRWGPGGQPLLDHVLGWMLVSTSTRLVAGDHLLVICEVRQAAVRPGADPLIRHDGGFHRLPPT